MKNALSIDVEDYYVGMPFNCWHRYESHLRCDLNYVVQVLDKYELSATFFVLGWMAENFEDVIEQIREKGHEIACHGYCHTPIYRQTRKEFEDDVTKSLSILRKIATKKILGYRAPYFSMTERSCWAIDVLEKLGFKYDSSIYPVGMHFYGIPKAPRHIYRPSKHNISSSDPNRNFVEFPLSTISFLGVNIPLSGGFSLRVLPFSLVKAGLKRINKQGYPAILYFHPYELGRTHPKTRLPLRHQLINYYNSKSMERKIRSLIREFKFTTISEVLSID